MRWPQWQQSKITGNKNNCGLRRSNLFTCQNFCKLFESLRLSITSTNGNRPKACFSNTILTLAGFAKYPAPTSFDRVQPTLVEPCCLRVEQALLQWHGSDSYIYKGYKNEIRKAKYSIESRNYWLLVFLTSADSSTSEVFVDLWLSLDTSFGTFSIISVK